MSAPLNSYAEYTRYIFFLLANRASIQSHTLAVYTTSQTVGTTRGQINFHTGHVLRVFELVDFVTHRILKYSYEVEQQGERLWWYDSMPHPHVTELQSTHPHHEHIPPDIKHNRIPAPGLSFIEPNLSYLIAEIEALS